MTEPVQAQQIMLASMAGAMVVMFGAIYAFLFTWSKMRQRGALMPLAYLAYLGLASSVAALAVALHLTGFWSLIVVTMLIGYLLAPHAIWHLCVRTHQSSEHISEPIDQAIDKATDGGLTP